MSIAQPSLDSTGALSKAANQWNMAANVPKQQAYDPEQFYTAAADKQGPWPKLPATICPKQLIHRLNKMVSADQFPEYESPQDVIRDAVAHLLAHREEQMTIEDREGVQATLREMAWRQEVHNEAEHVRAREATLDEFRGTLVELGRQDDWYEMDRFLTRAELNLESMPDPYASKMQAVITEWRSRMP